MKPILRHLGMLASVLLILVSLPATADLKEIQARGELRHIGIRYANFVTGAGDGFDVELAQGFARHIGVKYTLVYSDFYNVIRDLLGKDVVRKGSEVSLAGDFPIKGDLIATGFRRHLEPGARHCGNPGIDQRQERPGDGKDLPRPGQLRSQGQGHRPARLHQERQPERDGARTAQR